jgi:3-hydroxyisobutyrate dehydrogenase-like beta-hydroxyacid dehydrogenase
MRAAPVIVICVSDYAATEAILDSDGAEHALNGRLVVQLSSGLPKQARALEERVKWAGGRYLDGAIAAWPRQIGTDEAALIMCGRSEHFSQAGPILQVLARNVTYVGDEIGTALTLFNAALSYLAGHWIGFSFGAAICQAENLPVDRFAELLSGLGPSLVEDMRHMGKIISEGSFARPESTIRTAGADIARLVELSGDLKINRAWPEFSASVFQRSVEAGLGAEEHCAIIKLLKQP